jgi:NitT/TauT family transport system ATP-binding protein
VNDEPCGKAPPGPPDKRKQRLGRTAGSAGAPKLSLCGVSKMYSSGGNGSGSRFYAVQDVSLDIFEGEFIGIVGPSGCGKSTLINLLAGFESPDEGTITCDGNPVAGAGPDRMVIFQEQSLFPWLTVARNIEFGMQVAGVGVQERRERAMHFMKMVHLNRFAKSFPFQLSGGMKQRVAIARALAVGPQMLLMDEPFSALDHRTRDLMHIELQQIWLATRKTIVFVTHSVEEALRLSDRIVVMASQPGHIRRIVQVPLPHPRDFFDPAITGLRAAILEELEDELNILLSREGDNDWKVEKGSLRSRPRPPVAGPVGGGVTSGT